MTEPELEALRREIDELDQILTGALEKRMDAVKQVAAYKEARSLPVLDREREQKVLAKTTGYLHNPEYAAPMQDIMEKVMETSRNLQIGILTEAMKKRARCADPIRIGYQGVQGSFSHQALEDYFAEIPKIEMNYIHFEDVVMAVKKGEVKYEVYALMRQYGCHIVGEKIIKVDQNLMALPGTRIADLQEVYSHPQGLDQSREFFKKYPQIELIPFFNTARSAQMVSEEGNKSKGAVASKQAARLYGLEILAENINFNAANHTRFIIIAAEPEHRPDADKITIVIAAKHEPGSLYHVLGHFYQCGLNLVNLESRPMEGKSWEYFFHIDLTGNLSDPGVARSLQELARYSTYCIVLGNYVADHKK